MRTPFEDDLMRSREAMQKDVRKVLDGFEQGVFVRSIHDDDDPKWISKLAPFIAALARLKVNS